MNKGSTNVFYLTECQTTALKGIAILFVLLGHMGYIFFAGAWGVSLFLMLSAYGLSSSYDKNGLSDFWRKKLWGVYLPYLVVTLIQIVALPVFDLKRIFTSILGLDFGYAVDKTMWYISFLFTWYALFFGVKSVTAFFSFRPITELLLYIPGGLIVLWMSSHGVWGNGAGSYLYVWAFPIGVLLHRLSKLRVSEKIRNLLFGGAFTASIAAVVIFYGREGTIASFYRYTVYALAGALVPLCLFQFTHIKSTRIDPLNFLGRYSYPIYLLEGFFLLKREPWFGSLNSGLLINAITLCLTIISAVAVWRGICAKIVIQKKKRLGLFRMNKKVSSNIYIYIYWYHALSLRRRFTAHTDGILIIMAHPMFQRLMGICM